MKDLSVMFARFPYGRQEDPDVTDWLVGAVLAAKDHPRIGSVHRFRGIDTPIPMLRNRALQTAKDMKIDFLVMIDADMAPDAYLASNPYRLGQVKDAKPFFESSLDFAIMSREMKQQPCVIGAPYCGPPPFENVYVFRWATSETGHPNADMRLEAYSREESITLRGIQEAGALPTGLILIDMRTLDGLEPPYSYYEWTDNQERQKASTDDVTLTRDLGLIGTPQYCNWDAWCGHWKLKCVGRPVPVTTKMIADKFRRALRKELNIDDGEELVVWGKDREQMSHIIWKAREAHAESPVKPSAATYSCMMEGWEINAAKEAAEGSYSRGPALSNSADESGPGPSDPGQVSASESQQDPQQCSAVDRLTAEAV